MLTMWVTEDEHRRLLERCDGNAVLNERVSDLSTQVLSLSEQLRRLSGN